MDILLINENTFKQLVPVSANIDITNNIIVSINEAQNRYIKPLFCTELWDKIQNEVANPPVSVEIQALIDEISPCLSWYSFYIFLIYGTYKMREVGTVQQNSDKATNVDTATITFMRQDALSSAKTYEIKLLEYTRRNMHVYNVNCGCSDCTGSEGIAPKTSARWFINI